MSAARRRTAEGGSSSRPRPHDRIAERAAKVRRRPWLVAALVTGIVALIGGLIYLFWFSAVLEVDDVVVRHEQEETGLPEDLAQDVLSAAAVPTGVPMARVDTGAAQDRVLQDLRLAEVSVQRSWPSTITVVVTPREPAIILTQPGEPERVADAAGVVYDQVSGDEASALRAGDHPGAAVPVLAARVPHGDIDEAQVRAALALISALDPALRDQISGLRVMDAGTLRFDLGSVRVDWGLPGQDQDKARVLLALLNQEQIDPDNEDTRITVNLTAPSAPVVRGLPEDPEG